MTPPATGPGAPDPLQADPMLRVLRERHPEVDIVGFQMGLTAGEFFDQFRLGHASMQS